MRQPFARRWNVCETRLRVSHVPEIPAAHPTGADGLDDADAPGDLAVALPERLLAGEEWVIRRRLMRPVRGNRPRGDGVLAWSRRSPVVGPEGPSELAAVPFI